MPEKKKVEATKAEEVKPPVPRYVPGVNTPREASKGRYAPGLGPDPNRPPQGKRNPC